MINMLTGVEKNNDDCRRIHLQKSNKWDAASDVVLVSKRLETLDKFERIPRSYRKRSSDYWQREIYDKRAKQRCNQQTNNNSENAPSNDQHIGIMSVEELKNALKDMGIKTRVRTLKRLQEMYKDALSDTS